MKLLLDEMWSPAVAEQLRQRGHVAAAVNERDDLRTMSDATIFEVAQHEELTIVTENSRDFRPLVVDYINRGRPHFGCIYTTHRQFPRDDDRTIGRLIRALDTLLQTKTQLTDIEHWLSRPR